MQDIGGSLEGYRYDIVGFAADHVGVELHDGQQDFLREAFRFKPDGTFEYKYPNVTASNRWGKTVVIAVVHLWFAVYKHGLFLEGRDWFEHPYGIINICPLVDLANVTRDMVNDLLMNKAKEQINRPGGRGYCDLGPLFERGEDGYLVTFGDYKGFRTKLTNVTMEYRTSADNAKAIQGTPKFLITFDEAGRQKRFQDTMGGHVVPRTLDTGGVTLTASTPDVDTGTDYEDWCTKGDPENFFRDPLFYWRRGAIHENPYVTNEQIEQLKAGVPDYLLPQVLEGKFVQGAEAFFAKPSIDRAFKMDMRPYEGREPGHLYIIGADLAVAKAGDRSVFVVLDATRLPYRVVRLIEPKRGTPHPVLIEQMRELLDYYNNEQSKSEAELSFDATGLGGRMFQTELATLTPAPRPFDFGGMTGKKLKLLSSVRILLDKGCIEIPGQYGSLKQELRDYRREDAKLNTDGVMALALACHLAELAAPIEIDESDFNAGVY